MMINDLKNKELIEQKCLEEETIKILSSELQKTKF